MAITEILNRLDNKALDAALTKCCASRRWVELMAAAHPFADDDAVLQQAAAIWNGLQHVDWREAFAAHPKIGDLESLRAKFGNTRDWASGEQSGVASAAETTIRQLAELNREYEARFGYIFIVCATGKSAEETLVILQQRLPNDPQRELAIAAGEQLKITLLRLQKLTP